MSWRRRAAAGAGALGLAAALLAACGAPQRVPAPSGTGTPAVSTGAPAPSGPAAAGSASAASTAGAPKAGAAVTGTYVIVDASSTASYQAHETFLGRNTRAAPIGKTSKITGSIVLSAGRIGPSSVKVDLRTLSTGNGMRDRHIQGQPLQTSQYPYASFSSAAPSGSAPLITAGASVALPISGTMTIHGTARPMTFTSKVAAQGNTLHITGTASFQFSTFGMSPPYIPGFVKVDPGILLSVALTATKK